MGMAILGSAEEDGCDEAGVTGGALDMTGEAMGIPSSIWRRDALLAAGISAGCGRPSCSTLYAVILFHLSRVKTSRQIRLPSN